MDTQTIEKKEDGSENAKATIASILEAYQAYRILTNETEAMECGECDGAGNVKSVNDGSIIDKVCENCDGQGEVAERPSYDGEIYTDPDALIEQLQEEPLSIEVRSPWHSPGEDIDNDGEFKILMATGGPACQIRGELDDGEPRRAWIEGQDWGTPWQQVFTHGEETEAILWFASLFCFVK